jgi:hypothetical protein
MKRTTLTAVAAALTIALAFAGTASANDDHHTVAAPTSAAPVRECGTQNAANGYQSIVNITSRNVACALGRHDAYVIYKEVGPDNRGYARCPHNCVVRWHGWTISVHYTSTAPVAGQKADVRSTASRGRVVHFQAYGE